ncbi:hypothetical protein M3Y97_00569700 [Aphelenchoides bicaudatus]|nr:hypothetical protein M3Y97_00569700 [Aphelenchoides bicaudatus]
MPEIFIVVGGGIAGVSCMLELIESAEQNDEIEFIFVCGKSGFIKTVENYEKLGIYMEKFDVKNEVPSQEFFKSKKVCGLLVAFYKSQFSFQIFMEDVILWEPNRMAILLTNLQTIHYSRLCISTGAVPKTLAQHPMDSVIQIRDIDSIEDLQSKLAKSRRVVIVGTGGIAMELAYELKNIEVYWASKSAYVGAPFFDATIGLALEERFNRGRVEGETKKEVKLNRYSIESDGQPAKTNKLNMGCSLGPNWLAKLEQPVKQERKRTLTIMRCVQVVNYNKYDPTGREGRNWNVYVEFENGQVVGCDFVIEALGVTPASVWKAWCPELNVADDSSIEVNENMRTNIDGTYACGDIATIKRKETPRTWKQMRLWTQARITGLFAGRCMADPDLQLDSWFEMFSHVTTFAGQKIVLLGDFLAETNDVEHVFGEHTLTRIVIENNRIIGAILVGDTGLDEVFETLILNSFNVSDLPRPIVNQQIDLADYFD